MENSGTTQGLSHTAPSKSRPPDAFFFGPAILLVARLLPLPRSGIIAGLPSICPFYHLTGLPCPACGLTRSMVCCAHGQWREATAFHVLGPAIFAACVAATVVWALGMVHPQWRYAPSQRFGTLLLWSGAICFTAAWFARLAGWLPPLG